MHLVSPSATTKKILKKKSEKITKGIKRPHSKIFI